MTYKHYSALGLDKSNNPSQSDIKKAYKKMAMEYHPDKNKDNAEAENKFKEISNAYEVLSDENKKRIYDQVGDEGENNHNSFGGDHDDIFEQFFRGHHPFGDRHSFPFGFGNEESNNDKQCNNINKHFNTTLDEVFEGINKNISLTITKNCHGCMTKCTNCNGTGMVKQVQSMGVFTQIFTGSCNKCQGGYRTEANKSCSDCQGNGTFTKTVNAHLHLPKGIDNGFKTIFEEMGEQPKIPKQKAGNLILEIRINDHKHFKRNGNDLIYKCDISYIDSVIGKEITIPYFKETVKINTNTFGVVHPNKQYMIEGKGMPILNSNKYGNMYVEFNIQYPKIKNKEKINELENLLKEVFAIH